MNTPLLSLQIRLELDIVLARQRARQIAGLLGFPPLDQTRIATVTSEVARNALEHGGGGKVEFLIESQDLPGLRIRIHERGTGLPEFRALLEGQPASPGGRPLSSLGTSPIMDQFQVEPGPGPGVIVSMVKVLPKRKTPFSMQEISKLTYELARQAPRNLIEEIQQQNQELLQTLQELRDRQAEIAQLHTRELEETNRGVVALYAELEENANAIQRISDLKSRFLSNMSHEFRSPLNTILTLSGFLLERTDGEITPEQEKQVNFIRKAAEGLSGLVNDLLDLAKVEAGKAVVRAQSFSIADLFETLQESTKPLLGQKAVELVFEAPTGLPNLYTDEGKVLQILRNFMSNAIKFTEQGEIRVFASAGPGGMIIFSVTDTGIGIAMKDRGRIFEEFGQVESPVQAKVKGTGLGLPLSRKLAELLGGTVSVRSELGVGSTFFAMIPTRYVAKDEQQANADGRSKPSGPRFPVLVVEDDPMDLLLYEKFLEGSEFQILPARNLFEARRALRKVRPVAVILDIVIESESGWTLLDELKKDDATRDIPVLVLTVVKDREQAMAFGAHEFQVKPINQSWLQETLRSLKHAGEIEKVLIIDNEESYRYLLKEILSLQGRFAFIEAEDGEEGLERARDTRPSVIFLDLMMKGMSGFEVLEHLKADPATKAIPVIVNTSKLIDDDDLGRLTPNTAAILPKRAETREEGAVRVREVLIKAGLEPAAPREGFAHG
ncbi:response regulator [Singulisphaera sp. PoT]|uniref:response regulator n=1 Tax=Singulisphaera sp. PoT TaxID=3411797 RepID=UPI003BF46CA5